MTASQLPSEHYELLWRGREVRVVYHPSALGFMTDYEHIEVLSNPRQALPITETGYRSLFLPSGAIEEGGGPVAFVTRWLDHKANTREWKQTDLQSRQGSLF